MPKSLKVLRLQIAEAEATLERINGSIAVSKQQLLDITKATKAAQAAHDQTIAALKRKLKPALEKIRRQHAEAIQRLTDEQTALQTDVTNLIVQKGGLEFDIGEQQAKLQRLQSQYSGTRQHNYGRLVVLREQIEAAEDKAKAVQEQLAVIDETLLQKTGRLRHIEDLLVKAEQIFSTRSTELQEQLKTAESRLAKLQHLIQEYDKSMDTVRQQDATRAKDLAEREAKLAAGRRALAKDRQDLADEKQRFYQTKAL
jgi:hypothetical protein